MLYSPVRVAPAWLLCVSLGWLLCWFGASAAGPVDAPYRVTHWTVENELPQNTINALAQTRDGYLWIGTLRGLARFNGRKFRVFDHTNTPEMTHDSINGLVEDMRNEALWIGTGSGVLCYHNGSFEHYRDGQGTAGPVGVLAPAVQGGVWFSPGAGRVALAREHEVQSWAFGPDATETVVHQIRAEGPWQLVILAGPPGALLKAFRFDVKSDVLAPLDGPPGEPGLYTLGRGPDGSDWICASQGVWKGHERAWQLFSNASPRAKPYRQQAYPTRDGQVWVIEYEPQGRARLHRLISGDLQRFSPAGLPASIDVTHLLEDCEGNLWVGTKSGLYRLEPLRLRAFSVAEGLASGDALAVSTRADGSILVGTAGGMNSLREGAVADVPSPPWSGDNKRVGVFCVDRQNRVWTGGPGLSLGWLQEGTWQSIPLPKDLPLKGGPRALYEDREGRLWIAGADAVLCREARVPQRRHLDGAQKQGAETFVRDAGTERWTVYSSTNGLSWPDIRVFHQDRQGDLWFGSFGGGLIRLHDGKFTTFATARGSHNNRAWCIHEDAEGVFWVGSEEGLNRFVPPSPVKRNSSKLATQAEGKKDPFFTFTKEHGLHDIVINNIQEDDFGYLWLSTLHGICRVDRRQLNAVAAGRRTRVDCVVFGEIDGMLNSECNGGDNQPAGCKDRDGRIYFPTMQGVVVVDPKRVGRVDVPPPVVVEQVKASQRTVFEAPARASQENRGGCRIAPGQARLIEIDYAAPTFSAPERVLFKYRLAGHNNAWVEDDENRRVAYYTDLRPGHYRFEVMARNAHGIWSEQAARFQFYVAPYYWQRWSFWLGSGLLALAGSLGFHHSRVRRLQRIQSLEQQRVLQEERTRIARDLHDDLGPNLTGLALQLDLARNQNAMPEAAQRQLASLARTTRGLVDNMREVIWAMNPQHDNVESLAGFLSQYAETYLEAAGLRFRLECPEELPSRPLRSQARHQVFLVVKEALHNIVRHAQASEVRFRLQQRNGHLEIIVADNGRGLGPAREPAQDHGLENMRKRISDLGGKFAAHCEPERGTRIEILVPISS